MDQLVGGDKLRLQVYNRTSTVDLDVAGLQVDITCAQSFVWRADPARFRLNLLGAGCAKIVSGTASEEETAEQERARSAGKGVWAVPSSPTSSAAPSNSAQAPGAQSGGPSWLGRLGAWFAANWLPASGLLVAILAIPGLITGINRRLRYRKRVEIVLVGLSGAGKTDLWTAWADGSAPKSNARPTVKSARNTDLMPMVLHQYKLIPAVVDGVGGDPASMLDSVRGIARWHKRVLIFVVAPNRSNQPGQPPVNQEFVTEQQGYSYFPRALIGAKTERLRPDLVIVYLTKFDLLSPKPPEDTTSESGREELLSAFNTTITALRQECTKWRVPFQVIVGSSRKGWNVESLKTKVTELVFARKG